MTDITRLDELHAAATHGDWERCQSNEGKCKCGFVFSVTDNRLIARCVHDSRRKSEDKRAADSD